MKALESFGFVAIPDYSSFVRFNIFKGKYYRIKMMILAFLMAAICLYFALLGIYSRTAKYLIIAGILLLCCGMFGYVVRVNVKNFCKSRANIVRAKQKVVFGKNGLVHDLMLEPEPERNEYFYEDLKMIYDTKAALYLYFDKKSVLILPKRNLNMTPEETRAFLIKIVPNHLLTFCF